MISAWPLSATLFLVIIKSGSSQALFNDLVDFLPGYGPPPTPMAAGRLKVDTATRGVELFYVFTSVRPSLGDAGYASEDSVPIITWFQGGGGASPPWGKQTGPFALDNFQGGGPSTFGMLCEGIGPFTNPDNSSGVWVLHDNPRTWNTFAHLLFIDQPAGVGFSSFNASNNGYVSNGTVLGHDVAYALAEFFKRHPQLSKNPLYLFGESYAGHYVPHIASYIIDHGMEPHLRALRQQLYGLGLGDVCPGEEHSISLADLMHGLGYLDPVQVVQAHALASRCKADLSRRDFAAAFQSCEGLEVFKGLASGGIHDQDSRVYANYSSLSKLVNVDGATQEGRWSDLANAWLDDPATKAALHVSMISRSVGTNQRNTTRGLWDDDDNARSTIATWPKLISTLKTLVYNGNFDVSCNFLGTETMLASLGAWFEDADLGAAYTAQYYSQERRWMTLGSQMAGYVRKLGPIGPSGSLTHVIVQGAGHLAPRDQPARVQAMVQRFVKDETFCDQSEGFCRASDVALHALGNRCALLYNCSGHGFCTDEARCNCSHDWAGADCSHGLHVAEGAATRTFLLAPDGWQYHRFHKRAQLAIHQNTSAFPPRVLPRYGMLGHEGLVLYLSQMPYAWPPDELQSDLSTTFAQAFRLEGIDVARPIVLDVAPGSMFGVKNHGTGYHALSRAYTLSWKVAGSDSTLI